MLITPSAFAQAMAERWKNSLNGVVTPELTQVWCQQAEILNAKINGEYPGQWVVLQPPTGSGKSRGLETYCAMLPREQHPGVLIVVRMIDDAKSMVEAINTLAQDDVAIDRHDEHRVDLEDLFDYPVVVITHAAYQLAVESPSYWQGLMSWAGNKRKLVVIDESLNVIEQTQIDLDQLRQLQGVIPDWVRERYPDEYTRLDHVIGTMDSIVKSAKAQGKIVPVSDWKLSSPLCFSGLRRSMNKIEFDHDILQKSDEPEREGLAKKYKTILADLEKLVSAPCYYAKKGLFHLFTRTRVVIPPDRMDAVVMDATASCNPLYDLLGHRITMITPPENVRHYGNVTLHVSTGHKVGKLAMSKTPQEDAAKFMASMADKIPKDQRAFFCTHMDVEQHVLGYDEYFPGYAVSHWGAIDGKNDWHDCGSAVMYGLQYLDCIVPETTLMAIEEWSNKNFDPGIRSGLAHRLAVGHQITTLVQAINRVRCRRVTDANGGCDQTDIYLLLPDKTRSREILNGVLEQMPGIVLVKWQAEAPRRKVKRSSYEPALVACLKNKSRGTHAAQGIRQELGIPETTFDRLLAKAFDPVTDLCRELYAIGVSFHRHGEGKGGRGCFSWFEKIAEMA